MARRLPHELQHPAGMVGRVLQQSRGAARALHPPGGEPDAHRGVERARAVRPARGVFPAFRLPGAEQRQSLSRRYAYLGVRAQRIEEVSTNYPIEAATLGGSAQQGCVHRRGNAEVLLDRPTTELKLQQLPSVVVGNRSEE